jgi:hypothetical protein
LALQANNKPVIKASNPQNYKTDETDLLFRDASDAS